MSAAAKTAAKLAPLKQSETKTSSGSLVHSYTSDLGPETPILTLIHGYPQSAYEWRYVVPQLADKISLFVPELPGYGISTPANAHSKKAVGTALLEALQSVFQISKGSKRKVILGGHDRGARIVHRLAVNKNDFPELDVIGAVMLDIVPTQVQWAAFANPAVACGYFHWPLLANVDLAVQMIKAFGGGNWVRYAHSRIAGSEASKEKIFADGAVDLYAELFEKEDTLRYSCEDYASGAAPEASEQVEDQKAGRKIEVPTLVMFSKAKLGATQDVANVWRDWVKSGVDYQGIGVGNSAGHYLPEEASEDVVAAITDFIKKVT